MWETFSHCINIHACTLVNSPVGGYIHDMLYSGQRTLRGTPWEGPRGESVGESLRESLRLSLTQAHLAGAGV